MLQEKLKGKEAPKGKALSKEEEADVTLATAMGSMALSVPEMQQAIAGMVGSADPIMVAGQLTASIILNIKEKSMEAGMELSDNIWLARNGVADRLSDEIISLINNVTGQDISGQEQKVWIEAVNVLKMAGKSGSAPQQPAPAGQPQLPGNPPVGPAQAPQVMMGGMV